jgi:DNA-binding NtrC family response regulator
MTRVLVVEDDAAYGRLVCRMLVDAGFNVAIAPDYLEAMAIIESAEPVDLLMSDIKLPKGTPHGLSIGMMAMNKRKGLKVLYMTGSYKPASLAYLADNAPILQKPFTSKEMMDAIKMALG